MIVYIILLLIFLFSAFIAKVLPEFKNIMSSFLILTLIVISGFRYNVGMDYEVYDAIYNDIQNNIQSGIESRVEAGFHIGCKICSALGGTSQLMFLLMSIGTILLLYNSYRKNSPNMMMSLMIFLCFGQMYLSTFNAIRQCLSIGLFAYSIQYIKHRQLVKYIVAIGLAALFHKTAILLFPLYWLLSREYNKVILIILLIGCVCLTKLMIYIINNSPYAVYLNFDNFSKDASIINYLYFMISCTIFLFSDHVMKEYPDRQIFLNINYILLILFSIYISFSGTPLVMVVTRLTYYFIYFYAIIFCRILYDIKRSQLRFFAQCSFGVFMILMYLRTTISLGERYHLLPYQINLALF